MTFPLPESVLVANRGEIAARIFRTAKELGIRCIAVYTDAETNAAWTRLADEAYRLVGSSAAETYLNQPALLKVIEQSGARSVHPGYGFLSENAQFAQAIIDAGVTWIGPSPAAITALGDKAQARALATSQQVGVIPGSEAPIRSFEQIRDFGRLVGFPIVSKDPAGGGGRGILEFADEENLRTYCEERQLPTEGDFPENSPLSTSFLEKRLVGARHIETQCIRDSHGEFWLASTRDCSVQRRNQKLIEEAPAPHLPAQTLEDLNRWSQALFEAVDYVGAGTCEFLVDHKGNAYFLEVNPRLQVEHTVTEEVTGTDLVAMQLAISQGGRLCDLLPQMRDVRGHSIQLRITSEDPALGLIPTGGQITHLAWPSGAGIRIDAALQAGESIPTAFDSLIAKIIVTAATREHAIARAQRALQELQISGVAHCAPLYEKILNDPEFVTGDGSIHTRWLEATYLSAEGLSALAQATHSSAEGSSNGATSLGGTTPGQASTIGNALTLENALELPVEIDGKRHFLRLPAQILSALSTNPGANISAAAPAFPTATPATTGTQVRRQRRDNSAATPAGSGAITAPMQATVHRILVSEGQEVNAGDLLCIIEAMKMEQPLYATCSGTVASITVSEGDSVTTGQVLLSITERTESQ